jgi:hypothetical protein
MIAILIPVLGRAHLIRPLIGNIEATTSVPHSTVLIFSPGDGAIEQAAGTNSKVLLTEWEAGRADYAKKLELGVRQTTEPWIFQGATDLVFHAAWDTNALRLAQQTGLQVIGTNDLGNPGVRRGKHATHLLIARAYLEDPGGTADGSGLLFSEAYDHQYVDCEFVETATHRRQFAFARDSIVEHMHPHWRKGEMDATYDKAFRETLQDRALFVERRKLVTRLETLRKRTKQP